MPNQISLPKNLAKKENDAYLTLLALIDFLKKYDKKFEEFISISNISLTNPLNDEERSFILFAIIDCKKIPIDKLPDIYQFRKMIINKGVNPQKFDIELVIKLLKSYSLQEGSIHQIIAKQILNNPNNKSYKENNNIIC